MKLVNIYRSVSINEIHYVRMLLEEHEIAATVFDDTVASIAPHYVFGQGGMRLMVKEEDVEQAQSLIQAYEQSKDE